MGIAEPQGICHATLRATHTPLWAAAMPSFPCLELRSTLASNSDVGGVTLHNGFGKGPHFAPRIAWRQRGGGDIVS